MHIADLREQIAALQDERARLGALPRDRATVEQIVRQAVAVWHAEGAAHVEREISKIAKGAAHSLLVSHGIVAVGVPGVPQPFALNLGPMLVAVLGTDAVERALLRFVDQTPAGAPARERDARTAEIDIELDRLELEEEQTIVLAAGKGVHVARRCDARPEIVVSAPP